MTEAEFEAKRAYLVGRFFQPMLLAFEVEIGGERHAYPDNAIALEAITMLQAEIIESHPGGDPQGHSGDDTGPRAAATADGRKPSPRL